MLRACLLEKEQWDQERHTAPSFLRLAGVSPLFSRELCKQQSRARRPPGHPETRSVLDCLHNLVFLENYVDLSLGASEEGLGWHPENLSGARNRTTSSLLTAVPVARR